MATITGNLIAQGLCMRFSHPKGNPRIALFSDHWLIRLRTQLNIGVFTALVFGSAHCFLPPAEKITPGCFYPAVFAA